VSKKQLIESEFSSFTNAKKRALLAAYLNGAQIKKAAALAGISYQAHRNWMRVDAKYREAFELIKVIQVDCAEHSLYERGVVGLDRPKFYKGKPIMVPLMVPLVKDGKKVYDEDGKIIKVVYLDEHGQQTLVPYVEREYDTTAAIFWLKGALPEKYRDRYEHRHSGPAGGPIQMQNVKVIEDGDWYKNADRLFAASDGTSIADPLEPIAVQAGGMRPAVGQNGNGPYRGIEGPRADEGDVQGGD
jgi:hypothetical protein